MSGSMNGVWRRNKAEPVRHRQTKGAAKDMFDLPSPAHTSTLPRLCENVVAAGDHATQCQQRLTKRPEKFRMDGIWSFIFARCRTLSVNEAAASGNAALMTVSQRNAAIVTACAD